MLRTEIILMPSSSLSFINSDTNLLLNSENNNTFLLGIDNRGFINFKFGDDITRQEISCIPILGETTKNRSCFNTNQNQNTNDYILGQGINTRNGDNSIFVDYSKFSYTLLRKTQTDYDLRFEFGLNENIQTDSKGHLTAGWFKYDPRSYLGFGFEGFSNPFIWNKRSFGASLAFNICQGIKIFLSYGTKQKYSSQANQINNYTNGILSEKTPSIFTTGLYFDSINNLLNSKFSIIFQNINEGKKSYNSNLYWTIPDTQNKEDKQFSPGSITTKAASCLAKHINEKSQNTQSYTGILSLEIIKGIEINGACTISNFDITNNGNNVSLSKWSFGCNNKINDINNICGNHFGINIGTPTYLKNGDENIINKDKKPIICECYSLITFMGLNIPLYLNFMDNKIVGSETYNDLLTTPSFSAVGKTFIFGIRPNKIFNYIIENNNIENKETTILPCNDFPEGSLFINENEDL